MKELPERYQLKNAFSMPPNVAVDSAKALIADLRPVCPNCHAMLHKANITIEELKKILKK